MSNHPHTLDNLCKKDKDKVVEMLRQLNELKKRCTALEQELDEKRLDNQRLEGRDDVMTQQLEAIQSKLIESVQVSKDSQNQIEQLTSKLQKSESDKKLLQARLKDAQTESMSLHDQIRLLQQKHECLHANVGINCRIVTCDKMVNTEDTALNLMNAAVQAPLESSFAQPVYSNTNQPNLPPSSNSISFNQYSSQISSSYQMPPPQAPFQSPPPRQQNPSFSQNRSSYTTNESYQTEVDDDLMQLISALNQF